METAYLHDLHTEGLQPGQEPVQRGLIPERAVQDRLDRLNRGAEQLEVKEGFGRRDPDDADLVVRRWQQALQRMAMAWVKYLTLSRPGVRRVMHHG
jgi:hypothetical protein